LLRFLGVVTTIAPISRSSLRVARPNLECQAQEGQIELDLLLVVSALAGGVRCRFCCTGESGGAVQHHIVLLLELPVALLASEAFFFPTTLVLVGWHGSMDPPML
jgi:hypothetical protein